MIINTTLAVKRPPLRLDIDAVMEATLYFKSSWRSVTCIGGAGRGRAGTVCRHHVSRDAVDADRVWAHLHEHVGASLVMLAEVGPAR